MKTIDRAIMTLDYGSFRIRSVEKINDKEVKILFDYIDEIARRANPGIDFMIANREDAKYLLKGNNKFLGGTRKILQDFVDGKW